MTGGPPEDGGTVVVVVPRRLRRVCLLAGLALVGSCAALAALLGSASALVDPGGAGGGTTQRFGLADRLAVLGIGVLLAAALGLLARPRITADRTGITVRNIGRATRLPWAVVMDVRLDRHASWAVLDLADDDTVPLLALQSNDGEQAQRAVVRLRALLAASRDGR